MSIEINMLPVGQADCIHIRFHDASGYRNIVIDSGRAGAERMFKRLLLKIHHIGEKVDLLCFSHVDNDHIMGATKLFSHSRGNWSFIKKVWLNVDGITYTEKAVKTINHTVTRKSFPKLTATEACRLYDYLQNHKIPVETGIVEGHSLKLGNAEVFVISPDENKHRSYQHQLSSRLRFRLLSSNYDTSKENEDSIAFVLRYRDHCCLFTGDAHANDLLNALKKYFPDTPMRCIKLSHHGSSRNLSPELLEQMKTRVFLISSNGSPGFPSDKTIEMLEQYQNDKVKYLLCNFELKNKIKRQLYLKKINLTKMTFEKEEMIVFSGDPNEF